MVDVDATGDVTGVEFAGPIEGFPVASIEALFSRFPALRSELQPVITRLAS